MLFGDLPHILAGQQQKNKCDTRRVQTLSEISYHIDYFIVLIWKHNTYSLDMIHIFLLPKDNSAVKKKAAFIDLLDIFSCNKSS